MRGDGDPNCKHKYWGGDDRGNHWCTGCDLWHDWPHNSVQPPVGAVQDPKDCEPSRLTDEPPPGSIVVDGSGTRWVRTDDSLFPTDGWRNWEMANTTGDPESWIRVCESGPVTVVDWSS